MHCEKRFARDGLLVGTTAIICFAVAIPLASSTRHTTAATYTVWPGNAARFANIDWSCNYQPAIPQRGIGRAVVCRRESTNTGVSLTLTGDFLRVFKCRHNDCLKVLEQPRNP